MSKKRYSPEEISGKLREADVLLSQGKKVVDVIKNINGAGGGEDNYESNARIR